MHLDLFLSNFLNSSNLDYVHFQTFLLQNLKSHIFENYVQHLPNTTSKEMPLEMIREANPELAIFADGLDEISNEFRLIILKNINHPIIAIDNV